MFKAVKYIRWLIHEKEVAYERLLKSWEREDRNPDVEKYSQWSEDYDRKYQAVRNRLDACLDMFITVYGRESARQYDLI